jgi:branched-chain amino acid transport system permease protein
VEPSALTFMVIGLFQGALYGLLAVGLVLVYKGTRVFNFAQGEFGTVAAFVTFQFATGVKVPYLLAVLVGLAAAVLVGLIMERLVVRPLFDSSRITLLVATVGFALLVIAVTVLIAKPETRVMPPLVKGDFVRIFGVALERQQVLALLVLGALAALLAVFFRRTNLGLAVLALSQDPLATRIVGISVTRISRFIWGFAALLGGIAGILQGGIPGNFIAPGFMTSTSLVPAFTGAVLGGMTSLPGAFVGGLLVGVAQNLGIFYLGNQLGIPGPSDITIFGLLLMVLLIRPQGLLGTEA